MSWVVDHFEVESYEDCVSEGVGDEFALGRVQDCRRSEDRSPVSLGSFGPGALRHISCILCDVS